MDMVSSRVLIAMIPVADAERARRFYEETLGLTFVRDDGVALVFTGREVTLRLTRVEGFTPQPFTILGWEVDDLGASMAQLCGRGAVFERFEGLEQDERGVWTAPNGDQVAWLKDSEGNVLSMSRHSGQT